MKSPKCPNCGTDYLPEKREAIIQCTCGTVFSVTIEKQYKTAVILPPLKTKENGK
jgi:uncharacterized Zn finger protein